jgi:Protein of unknown function (DUF2802)
MADSILDPTLGGLEMFLFGVRALVLLGAFAVFAWALLRMRQESTEQLAALQQSQRELLAQTQVLAERVAALATLVASHPRRPEPAAVSEPPPPPRVTPRRHPGAPSYETAKRLARSGASVAEIVAGSGVAGTEARLLHRLQGAEPHHDNAAA